MRVSARPKRNASQEGIGGILTLRTKYLDAPIGGRADGIPAVGGFVSRYRAVVERKGLDSLVDVHQEVGNDVLHTEQATAVLRSRPIEERKALPDISEAKDAHRLEGGWRQCSWPADVPVQDAFYLFGIDPKDNTR